jgi:hypothetical protein
MARLHELVVPRRRRNGLVVTPVGRWGRGPLRYGARVEVVTAIGKLPVGATLLPPAFGGKDVHQPCEGGQRAKLRLRPHLFGFDGFGAAFNGDRRPGC